MKTARIIDFLLTLLPGSRSDPTSLEARIRRAADSAAETVRQANAHQAAVTAQVNEDAHGMVEVHVQTIAYSVDQLVRLKEVVRPEERAQLADLVRGLNSVLEEAGV